MFESIISFFKKLNKKEEDKTNKDTAKERLHLVLMQDRANVSADFLEMMKQEIIDVIKKYIDVDENEIDVKLTNKQNSDGTTGAPALYANIPIISIKNESRKISQQKENTEKAEDKKNKIDDNTKNINDDINKKIEQENTEVKEKSIKAEAHKSEVENKEKIDGKEQPVKADNESNQISKADKTASSYKKVQPKKKTTKKRK